MPTIDKGGSYFSLCTYATTRTRFRVCVGCTRCTWASMLWPTRGGECSLFKGTILRDSSKRGNPSVWVLRSIFVFDFAFWTFGWQMELDVTIRTWVIRFYWLLKNYYHRHTKQIFVNYIRFKIFPAAARRLIISCHFFHKGGFFF